MPEQSELAPSFDAIRSDLEWMTARWNELAEPVEFELRAFKEHCQPQTARFSRDDMAEAVHWASDLNVRSYNIYVVRNPIRAQGAGSAKDTDIVAAFYLWADCDDEGSADNIRRFDGPKYNAAVVTGRAPSIRVHTYWSLATACTDMALWRSLQVGIARHFGSDGQVINPSRIMRLGGTVAWPDSRKQGKGYEPHLTELKLAPISSDRPAVTLDQMQRVFGTSTAATGGLQIDVGPQALDRDRARIQALSGQEWHHSVVRLVASYVSKGLTDDEIHGLTDPLTLPGYSVDQTRAEVQVAIDGARAKGWTPEPKPEPNFDHPAAETSTAVAAWSVQSAADFLSDFVAPEYLIDGVVQRGRLYTLTAPTGSGKTAVMLHIATAMSRGADVCGLETEPGSVIYLAGENPDDVRARVIAALDAEGIDPRDCNLHFISGTFSIRKDMELLQQALDAIPNVVMVVVDTLAAYFDGDDSNSNAQMLDFARVIRRITETRSRPAVIMPAHPVKNAVRTNLTPMGGSALLNEVDGNLCIWKREAAVELHWQGKHRGAEFQPLMFELKPVSSPRVVDRKGREMPTVMAVPLLETRAMEIAKSAHTKKELLLLNIEAYEGQSIVQRCVEIGLVNGKGEAKKSSLAALLGDLREERLIRSVLNNYYLTDKGKEAVEIINRGGSPVEVAE